MGFEIDAAAFEKDLENYINNLIPNALKAGVEKACLLIERDGKINCGIDEGILRASITHSVEENGPVVDGYVGSNLEYAIYHHQGTGVYALGGDGRQTPWIYKDKKGKFVLTVGSRPNPFLKNSVDKNEKEVKEIIEHAINGGK